MSCKRLNEKCQVSLVWKHGFLVFIICLVVFNLVLLIRMIKTDYQYEKYVNVIVSLMLLFNHIAFSYNIKGVVGWIMKIVASALLIFGSIYIFSRP